MGTTKPRKRAYFVHVRDEGTGVGVVATTNTEAKKIVFNKYAFEIGCDEYIDLRAQCKSDADVNDLEVGHLFIDDAGLIDGLKRGIYGYVEYCECPVCGNENQLYSCNNEHGYGCMECIEGADNDESRHKM